MEETKQGSTEGEQTGEIKCGMDAVKRERGSDTERRWKRGTGKAGVGYVKRGGMRRREGRKEGEGGG